MDSLPALLSRFEDVRIETLRLDLSGSAEEVCALLEHTYLPPMVPAERREAFERDAHARVEALADDGGRVPCTFEVLAVEAVRGAGA